MSEEVKRLGDVWVILNSTLLLISITLCYLGYGFIFSEMKGDKVRDMVKTERCWGISLGVSDIMAATLTIPIFLSGLMIQQDFLPQWLCYIAGFVDNLYLATSIWSIVMWSVCRYIFIRNPLSPNHLKLTRILILCVWIFACIVALIPLLFSMPYEFSAYSLTCSSNSPHYNLGLGLLTIVLSLLVITVIFSLTFLVTSRIDRSTSSRTSSVMYEKLPTAVPRKMKRNRKSKSTYFGQIVEQKGDAALPARLAEGQRVRSETAVICEEAKDEVMAKQERQTGALIEGVQQPIMSLPTNHWHTEDFTENEPHKMISSASAETIYSDMISPSFSGTTFKWSAIPPLKRSIQVTKLKEEKKKKEKRKSLTGSKRTLVVLTCLFATQVVSLLPIFLLFLLVHYSGNHSLIPSQQVIILMTTLMVCNTGINPMIRIVIVPSYNAMFVMKTRNMCSTVVSSLSLMKTALLGRSVNNT